MTNAFARELKRVVNLLKTQYQPSKIILYGSLARGYVDPDSDLDLVIIKKPINDFTTVSVTYSD